MIELVRRLWSDRGVREAFRRRNEFQISDSAGYFLDGLDRLVEAGYVPTQDDILRVRAPTVGILEYCFDLQVSRGRSQFCTFSLWSQGASFGNYFSRCFINCDDT